MTDWMRARPKLTAALGGVVALAVLMLVFVLAGHGDKPSSKEPADFGAPLPTLPTRSPVKLPTTSPSASPSTAAQVQAAAQNAFKQFGNGFSSGNLGSGTISMPGLQGGSIYKYLPKHTLTLRVTSEAPIGTIGYIVPTSLHQNYGVVKNANTSWSLTTTAYGDPDYAQVFIKAGARGFPITCTILVDGHVSEHRSTEGPYGQMVCQG
ncbi:hypothetical protein [Nocardioides marmorisolisilvae]|uniref:Uncharacterized protein n=1 Tax=Nocardioides marmorisolisilvae TaxID=1542737 RepID=A0A3N0E0B8_9ACTN|nr:hypothetical protein [Nocardioides marmorisolisilvae]RNL81298.1 hypothetical protein EFL95_02775 [Nocardioides marmorisolisilvae]